MAVVDVKAPMVASVFEITCSVGDAIAEGDELLVLESMKMEIPVEAECSGSVVEILVELKESIDEDSVLLRIDTGG